MTFLSLQWPAPPLQESTTCGRRILHPSILAFPGRGPEGPAKVRSQRARTRSLRRTTAVPRAPRRAPLRPRRTPWLPSSSWPPSQRPVRCSTSSRTWAASWTPIASLLARSCRARAQNDRRPTSPTDVLCAPGSIGPRPSSTSTCARSTRCSSKPMTRICPSSNRFHFNLMEHE